MSATEASDGLALYSINISTLLFAYTVKTAKDGTRTSYRVCEYLYEKHRQYDKILGCYLQDPSRKPQVFYFAKQILNSQNHTTEEKETLEERIISSIEELVDIDNKRTSQILLEFFPHRLQDVVQLLKGKPVILYQLLQGLFSNREAMCSSVTFNNKDLPTIHPIVMETYISLMCQYDPSLVHYYIRSAEGYRLEETLEICRTYHVMDATAYLLEKAGDVHGAFNIMLEELQSKTRAVTDELLKENSDTDLELSVSWNGLQTHLIVIIQLCQRNSSKMDQNERESLWFPLLESMMAPQRQLRGRVSAKFLGAFKELTRHLLNSMMGYISLPAILQRVVQDPAYNTGKFGEIRELIMGMFETYNYEKTLLSTTTNLLNNDLHTQLYRLCLAANRGYSCHNNVCCICKNPLKKDSDAEAVIFRCGHVYHTSCLGNTKDVNVNLDGFQTFTCVKCARRHRASPIINNPRIFEKDPMCKLSSAGISSERSRLPSMKEAHLSAQQLQALDYLRMCQKTSSRLSLLEDLSRGEQSRRSRGAVSFSEPQEDSLKLCLTPGWQGSFSSEF